MTTIAWDGTQLAGDKQSSLFRSQVTKIHRLDDGRLFGASGNLEDLHAALAWLNGEAAGKPKLNESFHAILVTGNSISVMEEGLIPMRHTQTKYIAIGSGRDFAMAALYLGQSAENAVRIAHKFDPNTGFDIDVL